MIKIFKFVPVQLTVFLILGILFGKRLFFPIEQLPLVSTLQLVIFGGLYFLSEKLQKLHKLVTICSFSLFFFIGFTSINIEKIENQKNHYSNSKSFSVNQVLPIKIEILKKLKPNKFYDKYEAEVLTINDVNYNGKVLLQVKKDSALRSFKVDSKLFLLAEFTPIRAALNPYEFNYKKYLSERLIYHQIIIEKGSFLVLNSNTKSLKGAASKIRFTINEALKKNGFGGEELAIMNALLLGQRQSVSKELLQHYSNAGAIHILAVSGLHVGIIMLLLSFLFKPLHYFKWGKITAMFLVVISLWIYAIIAGLSPSIVRAVTMFTALTIGIYVNKPTNVYNTLFISMLFLLLFNPLFLFEIGFQLSYLAVFSIVWLQPKLYKLIHLKFWFFRKLWQLFTVSLAAQIGVLPLSLYYFHQFPGLFFISNLVIIPFLGFILAFGIAVIFFSVFDVLPKFLGELFQEIINALNTFIAWVSAQERFILSEVTFSLELMLSVYLFLLALVLFVELKQIKYLYATFFVIIGIQSFMFVNKFNNQTENSLIVFNKSRNSLIAERKGNLLKVFSTIDSINEKEYPLKPYLVEANLKDVTFNKLLNIYYFKNETILVIDKDGFYNFKTIKPNIVLLVNSPKINIERMIHLLQPKVIIADASNYKSYINKWAATCIKNKTPFHYTQQKGAFILK
jgi:competence protein ComEC